MPDNENKVEITAEYLNNLVTRVDQRLDNIENNTANKKLPTAEELSEMEDSLPPTRKDFKELRDGFKDTAKNAYKEIQNEDSLVEAGLKVYSEFKDEIQQVFEAAGGEFDKEVFDNLLAIETSRAEATAKAAGKETYNWYEVKDKLTKQLKKLARIQDDAVETDEINLEDRPTAKPTARSASPISDSSEVPGLNRQANTLTSLMTKIEKLSSEGKTVPDNLLVQAKDLRDDINQKIHKMPREKRAKFYSQLP